MTDETINLPDGKEVPIIKPDPMSGYATIRDWEKELRKVLNGILDALEKGESLGYFDSLIDIETHANLIMMARNRYVDMFNMLGGYDSNPKLHVTKDDIEKQYRGGYSHEFKERLIKLLVNEG